MIVAFPDVVATLGVVLVVARVPPEDRAEVEVAAAGPSLVLEVVPLEVVIEPREVECISRAVIPEGQRLGALVRHVPGLVAELVTDAGHKTAPFLLPHQAPVVARAGRARRVVDQLLEVVDVRVAAFLERHARAAVRIAVDAGVVAREGVLPAQGDLAGRIALETDPRVAVEEHAGGVLLARLVVELALELEDDARILADGVAAGDAPAVAAEPRGLRSELVIALRVGIADVADGRVDEPVERHGVGGRYLELESRLPVGARHEARDETLRLGRLRGGLRARLGGRGLRRGGGVELLLHRLEAKALRFHLRALRCDLGLEVAELVGQHGAGDASECRGHRGGHYLALHVSLLLHVGSLSCLFERIENGCDGAYFAPPATAAFRCARNSRRFLASRNSVICALTGIGFTAPPSCVLSLAAVWISPPY